ncbi:hypothetical protein [Dyella sp.]|uniref:hypothetical protein n=1 Tax=Dyella sp. TaxID=1869338 RepID=UPI002ED2E53E
MKLYKRVPLLIAMGFIAGVAAVMLTSVLAQAPAADSKYIVSIDEVKQRFVDGDLISGSYTRTVTLSDGSRHEITLTPTTRNGMQVVEVKDKLANGQVSQSYMWPNATQVNGALMINIKDVGELREMMKHAKAG